jgi:hypothetical protein
VNQLDIELADGTVISVDRDDEGNVLLLISSGEGERDRILARLLPPVAAYLAGQLAVRAGVAFAAVPSSASSLPSPTRGIPPAAVPHAPAGTAAPSHPSFDSRSSHEAPHL